MPVSKSDFVLLSEIRMEEARSLFNSGHFSGSYYLAGYALECLLKAFIAGSFRSGEIPDRDYVNRAYSHKFDQLLYLGNLRLEFENAKSRSKKFEAHWDLLMQWDVDSRYSVNIEKDAADLLAALSDETEGLISWLRRYL